MSPPAKRAPKASHMSIFPDDTRRIPAEHDGAEPRAKRAAQQHTSNAQAQRPGEAGIAASKTEKTKPHRFDKFALRIASGMITAIRVTLGVFSSPDKERWPFARLLDHLRGAESLAREMLREIAAEISIIPGKLRERRNEGSAPPEPSSERAPCFLLGVTKPNEKEVDSLSCHPGREAIRDPETQPANLEHLGPGSAPCGLGRDDEIESAFTRRIAALEDVLTHPGKHAVRMARALYRAENETGGRLIAKSPDDRLLDDINEVIAAFERGDDDNVARLHAQVLEAG